MIQIIQMKVAIIYERRKKKMNFISEMTRVLRIIIVL